MPRAGEKRHRITIKAPTRSQSATGEQSITYYTLATVWASVQPISGREKVQAEQLVAEEAYRVRFWWIKGVTTQCLIVHKGRNLEIFAAMNIDEKNEEYEVLCREAVD